MKPNASFFINLICLCYVIDEGLISEQKKTSDRKLHEIIEENLNFDFMSIKRIILTIMMHLLSVNSNKYCISTPKEHDLISYFFPLFVLPSNCEKRNERLALVNIFTSFLIADLYFYGYTVFLNDKIKKHSAFNFANGIQDDSLKSFISENYSLTEEGEEIIRLIQKSDLMLVLAAENTREDVFDVIKFQCKIGCCMNELIERCDELASELSTIGLDKNKNNSIYKSILLKYADVMDNLHNIDESELNEWF